MQIYRIKLGQVIQESPSRSSVGGYPFLAANQEWPKCKLCFEKMVLFFQFDLPLSIAPPFKPGSHLSVFMCPIHNEVPELLNSKDLPARYWELNEGHYKVFLNPPGIKDISHEIESHLAYFEITFEKTEESTVQVGIQQDGFPIGSQGFKIGGVPSWIQGPKNYYCCCGAEMVFLCQVPRDYGFKKAEQAEPQPDSFSDDQYCLFLGTESYIFACAKQCTPNSIWIEVQ